MLPTKMMVVVLLALVTDIGLASGREFNVHNRLEYKIWVGIQGNPGRGTPVKGGFGLNKGERRLVSISDGWAGRFWARTECNFDGNGQGHCVTGDCGNRLKCSGAGGDPPVTLAEIMLNGAGGNDYYYVSVVDGFNIPVQIKPVQGKAVGRYLCGAAACDRNINPKCPNSMKVQIDDNVVACKSSCLADNTDHSCCRGRFNDPKMCRNTPSAVYFNSNCPDARSHAYDDATSTFICQNTDYKIIFG